MKPEMLKDTLRWIAGVIFVLGAINVIYFLPKYLHCLDVSSYYRSDPRTVLYLSYLLGGVLSSVTFGFICMALAEIVEKLNKLTMGITTLEGNEVNEGSAEAVATND